jgi:methylase of polypeptide subunit release factors
LGRKFVVTPATLIPRAETEYMILAVRDWINDQTKKNTTDHLVLYDIGTGSGVLGVSVDCETNHIATRVMMTDIDTKCLEVARQNMEALVPAMYQHRFHIQTADLCDFLGSSDCVSPKNVQRGLDATTSDKNTLHHGVDMTPQSRQTHVFVSNLPYIPDHAFYSSDEVSVREWEPHHAFV